MILEEETFESFGYYPSELKPHSNKQILSACDECGKIRVNTKHNYHPLCVSCSVKKRGPLSEETRKKMSMARKGHIVTKETRKKISESKKGKHPSEELRKKLSEAHKGLQTGKNHPMYGKHLSEETKKKISDANRGRHLSDEARRKISEALKRRHYTKETRRKNRENRKHQIFPKHRTKPEVIFEGICKEYNLPFKYTGDGSFWVENINPDFIECNGKKIAVEVFSYWHNPLLRRNIRYSQTYEGRKKILKKYGWKLVVFWDNDLKRPDAEKFVLSVLKEEGLV